MKRKSVLVVSLILIICCAAGCGWESITEVEPAATATHTSTSDDIPAAPVPASNPAKAEMDVVPYCDAELEENPYTHTYPGSLTAYEYFIFEIFRGAQKVDFSDRLLEYSSTASLSGRGFLRFCISLPCLDEKSRFEEAFNDFYFGKMEQLRAYEKELWGETVECYKRQRGYEGCHRIYEQEALYAYTWGDFYSVIINEADKTGRYYYMPLCDNFDMGTGKRLTLDDVFTVDYRTYSKRIAESLREPDHYNEDFVQGIHAGYEDGSESIPMPIRENFLLTPHGLVIIYDTGEIAGMCIGPVLLIADYESISDILAIEVTG